jgi:HPr kinase/phosphorylase
LIRTLLVKDLAKALDLNILYMGKREYMELHTSDINRPGLQLTGFFELFIFDRVQIMGPVEMAYLKRLPKPKLKETLEHYLSYPIPCVVLSRRQIPPEELLEAAKKYDVPILDSPLTTTKLMHKTMTYLDGYLAPQITRHGVLMDIYGVGIMLTGESGIGKSETALELVKRGHRLVADDVVEIRMVEEGKLVGSSPEILRYLMEIRGLGIIDVRNMYGVGAVIHDKSIDIVMHFEPWDPEKPYERLGLREDTITMLDVKLPHLVTPVMPGRNLSILAEVAAMNFRLKKIGYSTAQELDRRMMDLSILQKKD